jgi:hypothetical protein
MIHVVVYSLSESKDKEYLIDSEKNYNYKIVFALSIFEEE